jgi:hypothetical protein
MKLMSYSFYYLAGSVGNQGQDYARLGPKGQAGTHDSSSRCGDHPYAERGGGIRSQASCREGGVVEQIVENVLCTKIECEVRLCAQEFKLVFMQF